MNLALDRVSDRGLALHTHAVGRRWIERWPAFSLALSDALNNEQLVRYAGADKRTGFAAPSMPADDLGPLIASLAGYANATAEKTSKRFVVLAIGDLVACDIVAAGPNSLEGAMPVRIAA